MLTLSLMLCALTFVMGAGGFVLYRRFISVLRRNHPEVWKAIGEPGLVFYGSLEGQRLAHRFVADREYGSLDDVAFVKLCRSYRAYVHAYTCVVIGACTTLFLSGLDLGVV